jgi:hypothetical protein
LKQKKRSVLDIYNGFHFPHEYSGEGRDIRLSTHVEKETRYIQDRQLLLFQ